MEVAHRTVTVPNEVKLIAAQSSYLSSWFLTMTWKNPCLVSNFGTVEVAASMSCLYNERERWPIRTAVQPLGWWNYLHSYNLACSKMWSSKLAKRPFRASFLKMMLTVKHQKAVLCHFVSGKNTLCARCYSSIWTKWTVTQWIGEMRKSKRRFWARCGSLPLLA